jgi:hypothetical protein
MMFASTEGTNNTLIGCSGEPIAGAGGSVAVGSGAFVAVGASVATGASVAAGPQADSSMEAATTRVNRTNTKRLFISSPLKRYKIYGAGNAPVIKIITQINCANKYAYVKKQLWFYIKTLAWFEMKCFLSKSCSGWVKAKAINGETIHVLPPALITGIVSGFRLKQL